MAVRKTEKKDRVVTISIKVTDLVALSDVLAHCEELGEVTSIQSHRGTLWTD